MNTGLAVLVKICKRKRDVIDSGGSSYRYFKKYKIFNTTSTATFSLIFSFFLVATVINPHLNR